MHHAVDGGRERNPGAFLHGQGVHVPAQQHRGTAGPAEAAVPRSTAVTEVDSVPRVTSYGEALSASRTFCWVRGSESPDLGLPVEPVPQSR
jgi:hypothetical protein